MDTYYSFDKIFGFAMILKDSTQAYASNMALQISYEQYKKFLKDVEKVKSVYPDYSEEQLQQLAKMKGEIGQALVKKMTTK